MVRSPVLLRVDKEKLPAAAASAAKSFNNRELEKAWATLGVQVAELNTVVTAIGELHSTHRMQPETTPAACRSTPHSTRPTDIIAFGVHKRSRWLDAASGEMTLPLVRKVEVELMSDDDLDWQARELRVTLEDGHACRVLFSPHPCLWHKFD